MAAPEYPGSLSAAICEIASPIALEVVAQVLMSPARATDLASCLGHQEQVMTETCDRLLFFSVLQENSNGELVADLELIRRLMPYSCSA